jgi:hypothetical protein
LKYSPIIVPNASCLETHTHPKPKSKIDLEIHRGQLEILSSIIVMERDAAVSQHKAANATKNARKEKERSENEAAEVELGLRFEDVDIVSPTSTTLLGGNPVSVLARGLAEGEICVHVKKNMQLFSQPFFLPLPSCSAAPPVIPELMGSGTGGVDADAHKKRAIENRSNAAAAALGVTETRYGPNAKKKNKRNVDGQDAFDELLASRRSESVNVVNLFGDLKTSLQGSPGKKRRDRIEQLNRLIHQFQQSAMNLKALGLDNSDDLKNMQTTTDKRNQLMNELP